MIVFIFRKYISFRVITAKKKTLSSLPLGETAVKQTLYYELATTIY